MKRIRFEVLPDKEGGWSITRDRVVIGTCDRKADAVRYGADRGRAAWKRGQRAQLFIKGMDGRIQDERTYGRDPERSKG